MASTEDDDDYVVARTYMPLDPYLPPPAPPAALPAPWNTRLKLLPQLCLLLLLRPVLLPQLLDWYAGASGHVPSGGFHAGAIPGVQLAALLQRHGGPVPLMVTCTCVATCLAELQAAAVAAAARVDA